MNCPNLIKTGDGQCNSFAQLFLQMLRIQGYIDVNTGTDVLASPSVQSAPICNNNSVMSARRNLWFLVKKWGFTDIPYNSNLTNCTTMPFHIITDDLGNEIGGSSEVFGIQYHKTYLGYAADFIGNPGQNSVNPQSWFSYHSIIKVGSIYYDPSYGVKYQNSNDMRDNYLDGWCLKTSNKSEIELNIDVNRDGSINDLRFNIWSASNQANLFPLSFE